MTRPVNIIVAQATDTRVIGKEGKMPWHLPSDLKYFKARTENQIVIMGRKTYESIGKPLPNRINIVISNNKEFKIKISKDPNPNIAEIWVVPDYETALKMASPFMDREIFVIGGGQVYEKAMKGPIQYLYVTWVSNKMGGLIKGDIFFPDIDYDIFKAIDTYDKTNDKEYDLTFITYTQDGDNKTNND